MYMRALSLVLSAILSLVCLLTGCGHDEAEEQYQEPQIQQEVKQYNNKITKEECEQWVIDNYESMKEDIENGELEIFFNEECQTLYLTREVSMDEIRWFYNDAIKEGEESARQINYVDQKIRVAKAYSSQIDEGIKAAFNSDIKVNFRYFTPSGYPMVWITDGEVIKDHFNIIDIENKFMN